MIENFYDNEPEVKKNNRLINVLIALCVVVVFYCLGQIGYKLWQYYTEDQDYISVRDAFIDTDWTDTTEKVVSSDNTDDHAEEGFSIADLYYKIVSVDHDGLNTVNEDYTAWLYFEDGDVSYPIMKGSDYIHLNFYGETTASGSIFIDDDADFTDLVTFVYGHNMYDGSMFGMLKTLYNDINNLKTPYFFIETEDGEVLTYYVFAIVKTTYESGLYRIPSDATYEDYLDDIYENCSYYSDCEELDNHNNIVALSTCYGASGTNNRVIIYGVQVDE